MTKNRVCAGVLLWMAFCPSFAGADGSDILEKWDRTSYSQVPLISLQGAAPAEIDRWAGYELRHGPSEIYLDGSTGRPAVCRTRGIPLTGSSAARGENAKSGVGSSVSTAVDSFLLEITPLLRLPAGVNLAPAEGPPGQGIEDFWKYEYLLTANGKKISSAGCRFFVDRGTLTSWACSNIFDQVPVPFVLDASEVLAIVQAYVGPTLESVEYSAPTQRIFAVREPSPRYRNQWEVLLVTADEKSFLATVDDATRAISSFRTLIYQNSPWSCSQSPAKPAEACAGTPSHPDWVFGTIAMPGERPTGAESDGCVVGMPFADFGAGFADFFGTYDAALVSKPKTSLTGQYFSLKYDRCGNNLKPMIVEGEIGGSIALGTLTADPCESVNAIQGNNTNAARTAYYFANLARDFAGCWLAGSAINMVQEYLNNTLPTGWFPNEIISNATTTLIEPCAGKYIEYQNSMLFGMADPEKNCRSAGEIPGIVVHEWAHGLDRWDDHPLSTGLTSSEATADVMDLLLFHDSCHGRGLFSSPQMFPGTLFSINPCTGSRELDSTKISTETSMKPSNLENHCEKQLGTARK